MHAMRAGPVAAALPFLLVVPRLSFFVIPFPSNSTRVLEHLRPYL